MIKPYLMPKLRRCRHGDAEELYERPLAIYRKAKHRWLRQVPVSSTISLPKSGGVRASMMPPRSLS